MRHMHMPVEWKQDRIKVIQFQRLQGDCLTVGCDSQFSGDAFFFHLRHQLHDAAGSEGQFQVAHRGEGVHLIHIKIIGMQKLQRFFHLRLRLGAQAVLRLAGKVNILPEGDKGIAHHRLRISIPRRHVKIVHALFHRPGYISVRFFLSVRTVIPPVVFRGGDNAAVADGGNLKSCSAQITVLHLIPFQNSIRVFHLPAVPPASFRAFVYTGPLFLKKNRSITILSSSISYPAFRKKQPAGNSLPCRLYKIINPSVLFFASRVRPISVRSCCPRSIPDPNRSRE